MGNHPEAHEKFYGRRKGQKMSARKHRLLDEVLPRVAIAPEDTGPLDPNTLFDFSPAEIWFEVGFGKGEHLAWQAKRNPDIGFIGCEPFLNGVAGLLTKIHEEGLKNVRILADDARLLMDRMPDHCLDRAFLLHPDPWPKARHARRRFVSPENLDRLSRLLKPGAEFRISTDHETYKAWVMLQMQSRADFSWQARTAEDWRTPHADWPGTRYEAKALKDNVACAYFRFIKS